MNKLLVIILISFGGLATSAMDLTLKQCREMALTTDESLKIAENELLGARLDKDIAKTAYLPRLGGSATALYSIPDSKIGDMMTMQLRGAYMAGINLTQPIYAGGKIRAANRIAHIAQDISGEQLRATRMDILAQAEKSYWTYVAVLSKIEMTESYLAMMDSIYKMTECSVETGMTERNALLRVNTRRSEILYRLQQAKAGADMCRMSICRIIGVSDTTSINPVGYSFGNEALPPQSLNISNRPEMLILDKYIDIKRHQVDLTRADFLPTVGLQIGWSAYGNLKMKGYAQDESGNYMPFSYTSNSNGFMGLLSVQIPIFHWGEGIKKVKRAKIDVDNARLSKERNERLMQLEANQYYSNLQTGLQMIEAARIAMTEADDNLNVMKERYDVGLNTLTDMLEAQAQWQTSYSNLIEARTQYRINYIDYLRSIGELE